MYTRLEKAIRSKKIIYSPKVLKQAFLFAEKAHKGQKRDSGEPYLSHPFEVAMILIEMGLDANTIIAGLLHDTVEDSETTEDDIKNKFGDDVANLVLGVTKLEKINFVRDKAADNLTEKEEIEIENFRKFFLAMAKDPRVVLIKLADRLHNLKTLSHKNIESQGRIARETLNIFAPLADRLGMGQLKADLEDLAFSFYLPEDYKNVKKLVSERLEDRKKYVDEFKEILKKNFHKSGVSVISIEGRAKHFYSIYKKLQKTEGDIDKIYDLMAIRIIVRDVSSCYKTLGAIHQGYKPLIYRIKDYIAVPKPNGYQSLHTTVFGHEGRITEVQIRTTQMHQEAEMGIAAHWHYNQAKSKLFGRRLQSSLAPKKELDWVKQLVEVQKDTSSREFIESLRLDFFKDRIFVFTPMGNLFNLPEGATPIDFAYQIHSEVGNHCIGARINGKIVNLDAKLENRDIVEILTSNKARPRRDWLNFVKTSTTKQHIRAWFRIQSREENLKSGEAILLKEFKNVEITIQNIKEKKVLEGLSLKNLEELYVKIGEGQITVKQVMRKISLTEERKVKTKEVKKTVGIIKGTEGIRYRLASCCSPKIGDIIAGYVTQGQGVSIHKRGCINITNKDKDKFISVSWKNTKTLYQIPIIIRAKNRVGLLKDITVLLSDKDINIGPVRSKQNGDMSEIDMILEIEKPNVIPPVLKSIMAIKDVRDVKRGG
ncbi:TPA: (p)ppGpp synthetase [candidate division CPR2 bacterium]|uniref:GTP pyrophosphokinase n=1 Tax=candidate division CPR2 bacterium GW2011_GWC1_41_48 TaxID=1618344 RepID=A0A0G0YJF3_UNCC2|nr:MAG: GTP pyrophosphokinase [candidate division CPR2 bacterium GW2011_GWC2_39_35]KKR29491.1 MAG: GTP pyrophosphokinase [candidate division CPR2 bacterium GW2011_GWD2_39_7]KKR29716.1 MAG: GTP pyrophosphokinase [candidate division CPR2 bacterium GW2011_GWD1_39_7]KKS09646.1 MAG: GTP pyrophosphokinase [candidate division CPR2 bacterium GW2011_GWC1_41_48]OGB59501.1 MAG: hypothetical protein A2Y27_00915 [candidate division CPR2 bacterium GWD1_39_7]OGB71718.1 MAG: hypothetical protein A2Y26_03790 [